MTRRHVLATALALAACGVVSAGCARRAPRTHTITIAQMRFTPATLVVVPGDTVQWVNDDLVPHTATASDGAFNSGSIAPGSSWRWTAGTRGTVPYVCALHPTMSAVVQVE